MPEKKLLLPIDYIVMDTETTGFFAKYDRIIEIAMIRCRNGEPVASFSQLINPKRKIPSEITEKTGITNQMVDSCLCFENFAEDIVDFIGDDIIVGHNISFDMRFLNNELVLSGYDELTNDTVDTLSISKKIIPDLYNHKIATLVDHFSIPAENLHRSLNDVKATNQILKGLLQETLNSNFKTIDTENGLELKIPKKKFYKATTRASEVSVDLEKIDKTHPLCNKKIVVTGALLCYTRESIYEALLLCGAVPKDTVTKDTDIVIVGESATPSPSGKIKKATQYKESGINIEILSDKDFFEKYSL